MGVIRWESFHRNFEKLSENMKAILLDQIMICERD